MAYPHDGARTAVRGARAAAPRTLHYDSALTLDELFEDFLAGSASIINRVGEFMIFVS